jgi:tetratricopeptide (TPR) repeat protein
LALDKSGQPSAAIAEAKRVTRANPASAPAWLLLGLAYQQLNQPANAIAPLREAFRLDPANQTALLELADAELTTGAAPAAIGHFRMLATRDPRLAKAWEGLGRAYLSLSESAFRQLEKQAPGSTYFQALLARSREDAPEHTKVPLPEPSSSPETLYRTSLAASQLAEESFAQLAALPSSPEIHAVLADSYQRLNRRLDAVAEWRKAVELAPTDRLFRARLAESLIRARIYPEAEQLLTALVSQQPENGQWQYLIGNLLLQLKRDDEALPHLIVATGRMPDMLPAHEALGRVYLDLGKPADAVPHLEKARPLDDGSISFALSSAYRQLGRTDDARAALLRYQALTKQRSAGDLK